MSSDHSVAQPGKGCGSTPSSGSKKRKEPEQDVPSGPDKDADLDLSLEELESIMSEEMDEPLQITANKKQCLESGRSSAAINPQLPNQQKIKTNLQLDRKGPTVTNQVSESQSKRSSNQAPNSELETHSLAIGVKRPETDVKEEEVSFEVRKTFVPWTHCLFLYYSIIYRTASPMFYFPFRLQGPKMGFRRTVKL